MTRFILLTGAFLGLGGVIAGAAFDHALVDKTAHAAESAIRYNQIYAVVITALGLILTYCKISDINRRRLSMAALFFIAGSVFFCGSLYAFAITGNIALAYGAPFGGVTLMTAWVFLGAIALMKR